MEKLKVNSLLRTVYEFKDSRGIVIYKEYYLGDIRHNENGPAIEFLDGSGEDQYYLNGIRLTKEQFLMS